MYPGGCVWKAHFPFQRTSGGGGGGDDGERSRYAHGWTGKIYPVCRSIATTIASPVGFWGFGFGWGNRHGKPVKWYVPSTESMPQQTSACWLQCLGPWSRVHGCRHQVDKGENGRGVGGLLKINLCFIMPGNLSGRLATGAYVQFSSVASQCWCGVLETVQCFCTHYVARLMLIFKFTVYIYDASWIKEQTRSNVA